MILTSDFHPMSMKNLLVLILLLSGALLGSCQCSEKPDVPPVAGSDAQAVTDAGGRPSYV